MLSQAKKTSPKSNTLNTSTMTKVKAFLISIAINIVIGFVATYLYLTNGWVVAELIAVITVLDTIWLIYNIFKIRKNDNQNDLEQ